MSTTIELTEQDRAILAEAPAEMRPVLGAYRQAMADLGIPLHRQGQCPPEPYPCPCKGMDEAVQARAIELLNDPDAVPCLDCWVPLPLNVTAYAVDGGGVCGPCGIRRYGDRAAEYLINEGYPVEPAPSATGQHQRTVECVECHEHGDPVGFYTDPLRRRPGGDAICGPCIDRYDEHLDAKSWTKQTITHHLFAHDRGFYYTSADTKRSLVEAHRKMHER